MHGILHFFLLVSTGQYLHLRLGQLNVFHTLLVLHFLHFVMKDLLCELRSFFSRGASFLLQLEEKRPLVPSPILVALLSWNSAGLA